MARGNLMTAVHRIGSAMHAIAEASELPLEDRKHVLTLAIAHLAVAASALATDADIR
jgi:hypothetical protein